MSLTYALPNADHDHRFMVIIIIASLPTLVRGVLSALVTTGYKQTSIAYLITLLVTSPFCYCINEDTENLWLHIDLIFRIILFAVYSIIAYKTANSNNQDKLDLCATNYGKFLKLCVMFTIAIILCYMSIIYIFCLTKNELIIQPFAYLRNLTCLISIALQVFFLLKGKDKWAFCTFVLLFLASTIDSWNYEIYKETCLWIALSSIIYTITYLRKDAISNASLTLFVVDLIYIVAAFCIISLLNDYNNNLLILAEAFTLWIMILITDKHFVLKSIVFCLVLAVDFMVIHYLYDSSQWLNKEFVIKYGSTNGIVILGYLLIHASMFIEQKHKANKMLSCK
jgi:hypothetical protein